jgi:hypothetical protein
MKRLIHTAIFIMFFTITANAQLDTIVKFCSNFIQFPYISDGQQYRSILNQGETAEFRVTFYGGATYRIVTASEPKNSSVIFRLYDKKRNLLFSNSDYSTSTYWDFKFDSTVECFIEAELPENKASGFVILFIGFKQM